VEALVSDASGKADDRQLAVGLFVGGEERRPALAFQPVATPSRAEANNPETGSKSDSSSFSSWARVM
jgi:hypothetical protein